MFKSMHERLLLHPEPGEGAPAGDPPADDQDKSGKGDPPKEPEKREEAAKDKDNDKKGMVPVGELAVERKKRQEIEKKVVEITKSNEDFKKSLLELLDPDAADGDPETLIKKHQADKEAIETKATTALLKSAVAVIAAREGAADPEDIFALVKKDELEVDLETAEVKGVEDAVKELKSAKSYLFARQAPPPGGGTPPGSDPDPNSPKKADEEELKKKAKAGDPQAQIELIRRNREAKKTA